MVNSFYQVNVGFAVLPRATHALFGFQLTEFLFPKSNHGSTDVQHFGYFPNAVKQFFYFFFFVWHGTKVKKKTLIVKGLFGAGLFVCFENLYFIFSCYPDEVTTMAEFMMLDKVAAFFYLTQLLSSDYLSD